MHTLSSEFSRTKHAQDDLEQPHASPQVHSVPQQELESVAEIVEDIAVRGILSMFIFFQF